ncbi:hypothetical protein LOD99_4672 [Oopsacas minuta]|uniref:Uncharacterized protein n=1 Tax=Oopsacas minuta TaxID=111878 RepID=A0AAV7JT65_9METZ|nr:hypothetical protein LOD99_4672 [Oopsacas minuta]
MADCSDYSIDTVKRLVEQKKWEQVIDKCNEALLAIGEDMADPKYRFYRAKGNYETEDHTESLTDLRAILELEKSKISVTLRFDCLVMKAECLYSLEEYESCKQTVKTAFTQRSEPSLYQLINKCNAKLGLSGETAPVADVTQKKSFRHEWYQNDAIIVISILIKKVDKEDLTYQFKERHLLVDIKLPDNQSFVLNMELFGKILFTESRVTILPTKIEVRLKKATPGPWGKLERDKSSDTTSNIQSFCPDDPFIRQQDPQKFPTSSKTFKDWDKLAADVAKEEAEEKPEGDEALNKFFQQIYGKGSDEQKKAMMKSFQESGGTVLSTNWDEVAKDKVEMKPPDSMEFKKYDQ